MDIKTSEIFAAGHYVGVKVVSDYLYNRWNNLIDPILPNPKTGFRDACIKSLYLRASAWIQTLERMNNPVCIQAVVAIRRSLLEIIVDLFLLHHDKSNESGWKMHCWGQSEKLKNAEETIGFYASKGLPLPNQYEVRKRFFDQEKATIDHLRQQLWRTKNGRPIHPRRWTDNNLTDDIKQVDTLFGQHIKADLGVTLEELYCTEFRNMSWHVHSGMASVYDLSPEYYLLSFGVSVMQSADLGMLCAKIVLTDFGLTDQLPDLKTEWDRVKEHRAKLFFDVQTKNQEGSERE